LGNDSSRERHINTTMRIVRALAALAAQPRGTRRLLTLRFASDNAAVADAEVLAGLNDPVILDVRDTAEVEAGKGGPPASVPGAVHVPLNIDGVKQSERPTTQEEFLAAVAAAGLALPKDRPVVTHCGSGGRGGKAAGLLRDAGYDAYNGGGPAHVASALKLSS
jgi:rhodanese-related sulfurtransferase